MRDHEGAKYLQPVDTQSPTFAEDFDELPLWSSPFAAMLLEAVPIRPDQTVIDVGAGTGFLSIELAERCGHGATVIAVDPWAHALARLRARATRRGLHNLRTIESDIVSAPLEAGAADLIVSNLGLNNFEDPAAAVAACYRATRTEADLLLTTNVVGHMAEFYEAYRAALVDLGHSDRLTALDAHIGHRGSVDTASALLERGGFRVSAVETDAFSMRFASGEALLHHHLIRAGFLPAWIEVLGPHPAAASFAALEAILDRIAAREGEITLTIPMVCIHATRS